MASHSEGGATPEIPLRADMQVLIRATYNQLYCSSLHLRGHFSACDTSILNFKISSSSHLRPINIHPCF